MNKETVVKIKDGEYEQIFTFPDAKHSINCIKVFIECGFEVTIKLQAIKE